MTASESVGCGCIASMTSWAVVSSARAVTTSAIISVASWPMMWAPRTSPYLASTTTFTKPVWSPMAAALPDAAKGNLPTSTSKPASLAFASV